MIKYISKSRKYFSTLNPYKVLSLSENASLDEVKKTFVALTKKYNFQVGKNSHLAPVS